MISRIYKIFFLTFILVSVLHLSAQQNELSVDFQSDCSQDIFTFSGSSRIDFSYRKEVDHYVLKLRNVSFNEPFEKIFKRSYETLDRITYSRTDDSYIFRFYQKPNIQIISLATPQSNRTSLRLRFEQRGRALEPLDYQTEEVDSDKMYVIVDAGHGGSDPGAINQSLGITEKEVALDISLKIQEYLEDIPDVGVLMTRTDNRTVSLAQRAHFCRIHRDHAKLFISIHANAAGSRQRRPIARGLEIFYLNPHGASIVEARNLQEIENYQGEYVNISRREYADTESVNPLLQDLQRRSIHKVLEDSNEFANIVNDQFKNMPYYQIFNRGILRANFMLLRNIDMPSAIIETGYITHPEEGLLLSHPEFQDFIARGVVNATLQYLSKYNSSLNNHKLSIPDINYRALLSPVPRYTEEYTVQRGDTLNAIARRKGIKVADIRLYNNLSSTDRIYIGQNLTIPRSEPVGPRDTTTREYTVQAGDNLTRIARKFNLQVETIKSFNQLRSDNIHQGQTLKIPPAGKETPVSTSPIDYTVTRGDTLTSIASRFGTTVREIEQHNDLSSDRLYVGQELTVPQGTSSIETQPREYTIRRGDTLTSIANRFNTTIAQLRRHNDLRSDTLHPGKTISIPNPRQSEPREYTVQRGDTLTAIANRYGTTVNAIKEHNNLRSDSLQVGKIITIP